MVEKEKKSKKSSSTTTTLDTETQIDEVIQLKKMDAYTFTLGDMTSL